MGIDHVSPADLEYVSSLAVKEDAAPHAVPTFNSPERQEATLFDERRLLARWSHVEVGTSAAVRKRRLITDSIICRILARYRLPIVYAVEKRTGLSMLEHLDYGDAVQIAAEYLVYNGLTDGEWPLDNLTSSGTGSSEQAVVIEGMRRSVPSVYEVLFKWYGRCLVVRDLMAASGRDDHLMLYVDSDRTHRALRMHTLFTGRIVRFLEMAMPIGLLLPLSMSAAEALAHNLSGWAAANDRTSASHRAVERALHEYCIRAYLEDPARSH